MVERVRNLRVIRKGVSHAQIHTVLQLIISSADAERAHGLCSFVDIAAPDSADHDLWRICRSV